MDTLIGLLIGFGIAVILYAAWRLRRQDGHAQPRTEATHTLESMRAVGELVALKVYTQQVVTRSEHLLGEWGERWLNWLFSAKKMAMIFEFVVDFRYDLKSNMFNFTPQGETGLRIQLPPCFYEIQMRDIRIYDEAASKFVPMLLPGFLSQMLGGKFNESDKNQLIRAARQEAEGMARELSERLQRDVQRSAKATLSSIAQSAGFEEVKFKFTGRGPVIRSIDSTDLEQEAEKAVQQTED